MAYNERIEHTLTDKEYFLSDAPKQSGRTNFTPGTTNGRLLDMNWPVEFNVKVGNSFIDANGMKHVRVQKLGRNSICDQVLHSDEITDRIEVERNTGFEGVNS